MGKKQTISNAILYCRKSSFIIVAGFLFVLPSILFAQTAAELEAVMETPAITCAQATRFVMASAGAPLEEADFEQAMEKGWFPKGTTPDENITLGKLSFLMMQAFDMRGGMMYAILPGPRYAFRAMVSRSLIQGAADPAMTVNGDRFLQILGKVLSATGGE